MTIDASTFQEYGLPTWLNLMYSSSSRSGPGGRGGGFRRAKTRDLVRSLYPRDWSTCRNTFVAKRGGDDAFFSSFFSNASFFLSIVSVYKRNDRIVCYPGKNECKLIILRGSISVRNSSWKFFSLLSPAEILDSVRREIKISRRFFPFLTLNSFRIFENGWKIIQDEYVYSRRNIGSWNNVWNVATFFRPRCIRYSFIRKNGSNFSYSAPLLMEYYRWRNRVAFNRINARLNAHIYRYYLRVSFFKISQSRFPPLNNFRF